MEEWMMGGWSQAGEGKEGPRQREGKKKQVYIIVISAASSGQSLAREQSERFKRWIFQWVRSPI